MTRRDYTEQLLTDLLRLRRVQRRLPDSEDLLLVITELEQRLGHSVRRSVAARILGISEPTVQRRIDSGDLPAVLTDQLKYEVPVGALVQLLIDVDEVRRQDLEVEQPVFVVFARRREQARESRRLVEQQLKRWNFDPVADPHRRGEVRNQALHWLLSRKFDSVMASNAHQRLLAWEQNGAIHPSYAQRWNDLLARPLHEIREAIVSDTPNGRDLRQTSPLTELLTEPERLEVLELTR